MTTGVQRSPKRLERGIAADENGAGRCSVGTTGHQATNMTHTSQKRLGEKSIC